MNDVVPPAAAESAAAGVSRIALGIEYKGSRYRGWQRQEAGVPSVQEALERALSKVAAEPVGVICAGRTDAAVHASGQVVHFDTAVERPLKAWVMGTNANLPADISVTWARVMPAHFHARFSAMARRYRYAIYNDPIRPAHLAEEVTWNHRPLDIGRMREAAQVLVGTHDFTSFRAVQCQAKSPVKTMHHVRLLEHGRLIVLDIRGNAFLHHMVRNIAGVLMTIGAGERPIEWAKEVLEARDRRAGGVTAHPYGLYLVRVEYPGSSSCPSATWGRISFPDCPISSADVESGFCYHRKFPPDRPSGGSSLTRRGFSVVASRSHQDLRYHPSRGRPGRRRGGRRCHRPGVLCEEPAGGGYPSGAGNRSCPAAVRDQRRPVRQRQPLRTGEILDAVPLDLLQFHGDERAEDCEGHRRPYLKALRMKPGDDIVGRAAAYPGAAGILLDTYVEGVPGGTGAAFDWSLVPTDLGKPLVLAGGLTPDNVGRAVEQVKPYAVDVSGGVEASKGIKDAARVRAFVDAVRSRRRDET